MRLQWRIIERHNWYPELAELCFQLLWCAPLLPYNKSSQFSWLPRFYITKNKLWLELWVETLITWLFGSNKTAGVESCERWALGRVGTQLLHSYQIHRHTQRHIQRPMNINAFSIFSVFDVFSRFSMASSAPLRRALVTHWVNELSERYIYLSIALHFVHLSTQRLIVFMLNAKEIQFSAQICLYGKRLPNISHVFRISFSDLIQKITELRQKWRKRGEKELCRCEEWLQTIEMT